MFTRCSLTRQNIWVFLVTLLLISFPWHERLNAIFVVLLCIHWLADLQLLTKIKSLPAQLTRIIPFWIFFFLILLYLPATQHWEAAMQTIEVKLSFFVLPIILGSEHYFDQQQKRKSMMWFCASCLLVAIYCVVVYFVKEYPRFGMRFLFHRMHFSEPVMHPGYLSNFFALAIIYLTMTLFERPPLPVKVRLGYFSLIIVFLIVTFILASQTVLIILILFGLYCSWKLISPLTSKRLKIPVFVLAALIILTTFSIVPSIRHRVRETTQNLVKADTTVLFENSTQSRVAAWSLEWAIIRANWLKGYGTGNANALLLQKLQTEHYRDLEKNKMHTHNQFLHTWIEQGLAGVLSLLLLFLVCLRYFYRHKNETGMWAVLLLGLYCATDDALEIQAITVFLLFIICLLLFTPKHREGQITNL